MHNIHPWFLEFNFGQKGASDTRVDTDNAITVQKAFWPLQLWISETESGKQGLQHFSQSF